jgi:SCP1.201-like deaminase
VPEETGDGALDGSSGAGESGGGSSQGWETGTEEPVEFYPTEDDIASWDDWGGNTSAPTSFEGYPVEDDIGPPETHGGNTWADGAFDDEPVEYDAEPVDTSGTDPRTEGSFTGFPVEDEIPPLEPTDGQSQEDLAPSPPEAIALHDNAGEEPSRTEEPSDGTRPEDVPRVDVSENASWEPADQSLGPDGLPAYDGKDTLGRLTFGDEEYFLKSGVGLPGLEARTDPEIKAGAVTPGHVEGHAAMIMRKLELTEGTVTINHPRGPCRFCANVLENILPDGSRLTVVWPNGQQTFEGNAK